MYRLHVKKDLHKVKKQTYINQAALEVLAHDDVNTSECKAEIIYRQPRDTNSYLKNFHVVEQSLGLQKLTSLLIQRGDELQIIVI